MSLTVPSFHFVSELVRNLAGIVLEEDKSYLVENRLSQAAKKLGFDSPQQLVDMLQSKNPQDVQRFVVECLTTNETYFFRDVYPFEALKTDIVPRLLQERLNQRRLNFWFAAASSGQEPYSTAMTLCEHFPTLRTWTVNMLGTDINREVLDRARQGIYNQIEVNRGLPANYLVKYFTKNNNTWELSNEIRKMVNYEEFNLVKEWPHLPKMDVIFLRNVLIYFDVETKKKILSRIRNQLNPGGVLFLGGAETTIYLDDQYEMMRSGRSVWYQVKKQG